MKKDSKTNWDSIARWRANDIQEMLAEKEKVDPSRIRFGAYSWRRYLWMGKSKGYFTLDGQDTSLTRAMNKGDDVVQIVYVSDDKAPDNMVKSYPILWKRQGLPIMGKMEQLP